MKILVVLLFLFSLCRAAVVNNDWWANSIAIYNIHVWNFKDSNNDGVGDIKGLTSKLDYVKELGIPAIKISPIFSSPDEMTNEMAPDNFYGIHKTLGTMEDFDEFMTEAKNKDIKVILDININHCHESHEWFQKSIKKVNPYTNYFIWIDRQPNEDPIVNQPPNSWRNSIYKYAWEWNGDRKQFYYNYYNFLSPDFNLRNTDIKKEIQKILTFWLDKGVSGFNFLDINTYMEDEKVTGDNPKQINVHDTVELMKEFREFFDFYNKRNRGNERIMITEIKHEENFQVSKLFGTKEYPIFHLVTVNKLAEFNPKFTSPEFFTKDLKPWIGLIKNDMPIEWQLESADLSRIANQNNKEAAEIQLLIQALLPGPIRIHYGMELGMSEHSSYSRKCVDMKWEYRNSKTLPMQWDNSINAGFSSNKCPIQKPNPNYAFINVELEKKDKLSTYNFVKKLLKLRQNEIIKLGKLEFSKLSDTLLTITKKNEEDYAFTIISLNNVPEVVSFPSQLKYISSSWKVMIATPNSFYQEGDFVNPEARFSMRPISAMTLNNKYKNSAPKEEYDEDY